MSETVGELLTATLADIGATQVFGVVGDALNPFTDAIRRDRRMSWLGVRHEEGAALAAAGQAKLTGRLGVCAGTTEPGGNHLLPGLYEASHDHAPITALAHRLHAPIIHTYRALDLYPFDDPYVIGGLGLIGSKAGRDAVQDCDLLLMIGSDYPYGEFLPQKARVVQIDERPEAIGRRLPVTLGVVGSSRPAVAGLVERVSPKSDDTFLRRARKEWEAWGQMLDRKADLSRSSDRIHPQGLARAVSDLADDDAVFCIDTGEVTLWTGNWLRPRGRQQITGSFNNAAVGVALGMANGIQALDARRQVIVMCGDGGFAMLMQEFVTSAQHSLPVKVIVFNNAGWGLVHLEMEEAGLPVFEQGAVFKNPDFAMFAEACGARGYRVTRPQALRDTLAKALAEPGPVVVDVVVDPAEIPAMPHIDAGQVWKFGIGKLREVVA